MAEKISLALDVETQGAQRSLATLEKSFSAIKVVAAAAAAAFASKQVLDFLGAGVDAAIAQQQAMSQLGQQLKLTGEFSKTALSGFADFADEMERNTKYGDDLIISQVAVAKSFGVSNDRAKDLVIAATELSAATGDDLQSSVRKLGLTFSGVTGKLDEQIPALKGVSKEALAAGTAVDIVLARFGGSAAAEVKTFAGAMTQASNAFGNFQESIGTIIIENETLIEAIKVVRDIFGELEDVVNDNKSGISKFISGGIKAVVVAVPVATEVIGFFLRALQGIVTVGNLAFDGLLTIVEDFVLAFDRVFSPVIDAILTLGETAGIASPDIRKGFAKITDGVKSTLKDMSEASVSATAATIQGFEDFNTSYEGLQGKVEDYAQRIFDADEKITKSAKTAAAERAKAFGGGGRGGEPGGLSGVVGPGGDKTLRDISPEQNREVDAQIAAVISQMGVIDLWERVDWDTFESEASNRLKTAGLEMAASFAANIGGGKDGARQFVAKVGGAIAEVFAPGAGGAVAQALEVLGQDPEAFRAAINGFVEGIPEIIDNIVLNIPVLIEAIAANSGEIITALVSATPRIIVALAQAMPVVAQALAAEVGNGLQYQMEKFNIGAANFQNAVHGAGTDFANSAKNTGGKIAEAFKSLIPDIGSVFKNEIASAGQGFIDALLAGAQQFVDAITPGGGSGDNKTSTGYVEEKTGIDVGGVSFLTGGGSRSSSSVMSTFSSGSGSTTDALLLRVIQLLEQPMSVKATAMVREQAFADISLNLSRKNARLTA